MVTVVVYDKVLMMNMLASLNQLDSYEERKTEILNFCILYPTQCQFIQRIGTLFARQLP